jgi:hypothetical protein
MPTFKDYEKIEPVSGAEGSRLRATASDPQDALRKADFESAIEKADVPKVERREVAAVSPPPVEVQTTQPAKESLMELAKKTTQEVPKVAPTPSDLSTQAARLHQRLQTVEAGLTRIQNVEVQLPDATVKKLSTHIEHIDQGLRDVTKLTKGVEVGAIQAIGKDKPPLVRFLSYLTESDKKLNTFFDELGGLKIGEQKLTPDVLMAIQIKMGFISQELDFFTSMLNKALESTKTVMNVQI